MRKFLIIFSIVITFAISSHVGAFSVLADDFDVDYNGFDSYNYTAVDYIQSSNGAYIDINYIPQVNNNSSRIVIDFMPLEVGGIYYTYRLGGSFDGSNRTLFLYGSSAPGRIGVGSADQTLNYSFNANSRYKADISVNNGSISGSINGSNISGSYSGYSYSSYSYYIFAMNQIGQPVGNTNARIYSYKIYENNVLKRNLIPCYRNRDNVIGLYDSVSHSFFFNSSGTGSLIKGSNISKYSVNVDVSPSGSGEVTGTGSYYFNEYIELEAWENEGYIFNRWSDGTTDNPYGFHVGSNINITAIFDSISQTTYSLYYTSYPSDGGEVFGDPIGTYNSGDEITLEASAYDGYIFDHWSDGSTLNPYTFNINRNMNLTAIFVEDFIQYSLSYSVNPNGAGSISGSSEGLYNENSVINLTATANSGYEFVEWSNGSKLNPYSFNIISDTNLIAIFRQVYKPKDFDSYFESYSGSGYMNWYESVRLYQFTSVENFSGFNFVDKGNGILFEDLGLNQSSNMTGTSFYLANVTQEEFSNMTYSGYDSLTNTWYRDRSLGTYLREKNWTYTYLDDLYSYIGTHINGYVLSGSTSLTLSTGSISGLGKMFYYMQLVKTGSTYYNYYLKEYIYSGVAQLPNNYFGSLTYSLPQNNQNLILGEYTSNCDLGTINLTGTHTAIIDGQKYFNIQIKLYSTGSSYGTQGAGINSGQNIGNIQTSYNLSGYKAITEFSNISSTLSYYEYQRFLFQTLSDNIVGALGQTSGDISINNTTEEIINNYDIDINNSFNGLLNDITNRNNQIHLQDPEYNLPSDLVDNVESFGSMTNSIFGVFIDNGLGYMIFIPLLIGLLGLIL